MAAPAEIFECEFHPLFVVGADRIDVFPQGRGGVDRDQRQLVTVAPARRRSGAVGEGDHAAQNGFVELNVVVFQQDHRAELLPGELFQQSVQHQPQITVKIRGIRNQHGDVALFFGEIPRFAGELQDPVAQLWRHITGTGQRPRHGGGGASGNFGELSQCGF